MISQEIMQILQNIIDLSGYYTDSAAQLMHLPCDTVPKCMTYKEQALEFGCKARVPSHYW